MWLKWALVLVWVQPNLLSKQMFIEGKKNSRGLKSDFFNKAFKGIYYLSHPMWSWEVSLDIKAVNPGPKHIRDDSQRSSCELFIVGEKLTSSDRPSYLKFFPCKNWKRGWKHYHLFVACPAKKKTFHAIRNAYNVCFLASSECSMLGERILHPTWIFYSDWQWWYPWWTPQFSPIFWHNALTAQERKAALYCFPGSNAPHL